MANLLPNYLMRQWTPDGKPLSGGSIYFYFSGTNTPKPTYQDAGATIPHTNPVVLDASGHADIWLGDGAYRVHVFDQFGAQVAPPIDGINGEAGAGSDPGVYFDTYADLRSVTDYPQTAYVHGITAPGDGGQGWFERLPVTEPDDNGVILTAGSGSIAYRRLFPGYIDPRWYGVKYGVPLDQTVAHVDAMGGSARHNVPMQVSGSIRLDQTVVVPAGASIVAEHDGFYVSSLNIPFTFDAESTFSGSGRTFGVGVQPYFEQGSVSSIPLSWMAENSEDTRVTKWITSGSASIIQLDLDESPVIAIDLDIQSPLRQVGTSKFTWQAGLGALSLTVTKLLDPFTVNGIFDIHSSITNVTTGFADAYAQLEWFSFAPSTRALYLAARSGRVELRERTYTIDVIPGLPGSLSIKGAGVLSLINGASFAVGCTDLQLLDCGILTSQLTQWFVGDFLHATNATFPSTYTASQVNLDGCYYTDDFRNPVYAGQPGLYNAHLPLVRYAAVIGTDSNGKFVQKSNTDLVYAGAVWDLVADVNITPTRLKYENGKWFCLGAAGAYAYSIDGVSWTNRTVSNTGVTLQDIVWDGSYYVMVGYRTSDAAEAYAWRSSDGLNWFITTLPSTFGGPRYVRDIAVFGSKVYVVGLVWRYLESSDHGATWTEVQYYNPGAGSYPGELAIGFIGAVNNNLWICDGYGNSFYSAAPAGLGSFSAASTPSFSTAKYVVDVSYIAPKYRFVVSNGHAFSTSTLPYSTTTSDVSDYTVFSAITDVASGPAGARIFSVAGAGYDGYIATNLTNLGWMRRPVAVQSTQHKTVAYGNGMYLTAISTGRIYRTI